MNNTQKGTHMLPKKLIKINEIMDGIASDRPEWTKTRLPLVESMLDELHLDWTDRAKIYMDPTCGTGTFILSIVHRLMVGLSVQIPNKQNRIDWILQNQVHAYDINKFQIRTLKKMLELLYKDVNLDFTKYNIHVKNILKNKEIINMKFNMSNLVVVGNPPYNITLASGVQKQSAFIDFVYLFKDCSLLSFVIPGTWIPHQKNSDRLGKFKQYMLHNMSEITYFEKKDAAKRFDWPEVIGGVCYFQCTQKPSERISFKNKTLGLTFKPSREDVLEIGFLSPSVDPSILKTILQKTSSFETMANRHHRGILGSAEAHKLPDGPQKIICSKNRILHKEIPKKSQTDRSYDKVALRYASGYSVSEDAKFVSSSDNLTNSFMYFDILEGESYETILSYMSSKLVQYLRKCIMVNHNNTSLVWKVIPKIDLSKTWSDNELYELFGLTDEEIASIEKEIK